MLICHVGKAASSSQSRGTCNGRPDTNTPQNTAVTVMMVIISTTSIEKPPVVIVSMVRMTYAPTTDTVRNQSAQDPLCIEHALHGCRSPYRFASTESRARRLARRARIRYRGVDMKSDAIEHADVVVIGAGVIGASVAYHLARRGVDSILVVDKESAPGRGSTGRATGGYRAQFSTEINIRLSLLARDALRRFSEETGVDPGYKPVGYLWLATTPEEFEDLVQANALQKKVGLEEATLLDAQAVYQKNPFVRPKGVVGGAFCQTDGFIQPMEILRGYVEAAKRLGVRFAYKTNVIGLGCTDEYDEVHAVHTENGLFITTHAVVNACGAWASSIANVACVDLPVVPLRRQVALTKPCTRLPDDMPLTIFMNDGFHLRVRDGRVMLLWPTPDTTVAYYSDELDPE